MRENNWLQANLPRLLQQHEEKNIHARVMTFGYDADVWMSKSAAEIEEPVRNLLWSLKVERQNVRIPSLVRSHLRLTISKVSRSPIVLHRPQLRWHRRQTGTDI